LGELTIAGFLNWGGGIAVADIRFIPNELKRFRPAIINLEN